MTIKIDDTELRRRVLAELDWEPTVDASTIGVAAKDGVVTLTGSVTIYAQKKNAERATKRVSELLVSRQWMQIAGSPAERGEGRTAPTIRLRPDRRGRCKPARRAQRAAAVSSLGASARSRALATADSHHCSSSVPYGCIFDQLESRSNRVIFDAIAAVTLPRFFWYTMPS